MGDPWWGWLRAGLHLAGADGATSFPEVKGHTFSRGAGSSVVISSAKQRFSGVNSCYFPGGTNDYIESAASTDYSIGASWGFSFSLYPTAYPVSPANSRIVSVDVEGSLSGVEICIEQNGYVFAYRPNADNVPVLDSSIPSPLNTWTDWEVYCFNGVGFIFRNGAQVGYHASWKAPVATTSAQVFRVGRDPTNPSAQLSPYKGHLSDLRYWSGAARYPGIATGGGAIPAVTAPFEEGLLLTGHYKAGGEAGVVSAPRVWTPRSEIVTGLAIDTEHGGRGQIVGTTHNVGTPNYPVSRRVRLFRKRDGVLVREVWSDTAGNYVFNKIRHDIKYVVTGHDHTGLYNAEVSDSLEPEVV